MCLPISGQLPASRTHAERRWTWTPTRDLTQPALGTVSIVQGRRDCDSYSVDVVSIGRGAHDVLFVNLDHTAEVYGVTCTPAGSPVACTCPGQQFGRKKGIVCKHMETVKQLVAEDILPLANRVAA